jgi:hypothetical protein
MYFSKLNKLIISIKKVINNNYNNKISYFATNLISLLLGFFIANALATLPGQTGDWGLVVAGIIVAITEIISKSIYSISKKELNNHFLILITLINNLKIGIIYGFFVDSFKLGS